jgi:hypothetical protein
MTARSNVTLEVVSGGGGRAPRPRRAALTVRRRDTAHWDPCLQTRGLASRAFEGNSDGPPGVPVPLGSRWWGMHLRLLGTSRWACCGAAGPVRAGGRRGRHGLTTRPQHDGHGSGCTMERPTVADRASPGQAVPLHPSTSTAHDGRGPGRSAHGTQVRLAPSGSV